MRHNIINKIYMGALGCILVALSGCSEWLDVKPYDQISEEELLSSEDGFFKLLNGIYIELNHDDLYGSTLSVEMIEIMGGAYEIGTDNMVWGNYKDLSSYEYGTEYWRARLDATWNKAYALVLNCNKLLENIEGKEAMFTDDNYNIVRGEALALRAMLHFDMLRLFGPVYSRGKDRPAIPYYISQTNEPEPLLTAEQVVGNVIADLREARILLANDPVITQGTLMSGDVDGSSNFLRYRALRLNYYAVTGLLARVYMYMGDKSNAFAYSTEVIKAANNGTFPFVDKNLVIGSPDDPDRIFSTEVIFALSHSSRSKLFKNYFDPSRLPGCVLRMEPALMNNYIYGGGILTGGNQDDYRNLVNWSANGAYKYFYKYADKVATGSIENTMIPMLRLGEMYLIAAESQSDNLASGVSYVNTLRKARGISNLPTLTQDLLIYEYIREMYGEGQLFYLYKRLFSRIYFSANNNKNPLPSDEIFVVPLPDSETEN